MVHYYNRQQNEVTKLQCTYFSKSQQKEYIIFKAQFFKDFNERIENSTEIAVDALEFFEKEKDFNERIENSTKIAVDALEFFKLNIKEINSEIYTTTAAGNPNKFLKM